MHRHTSLWLGLLSLGWLLLCCLDCKNEAAKRVPPCTQRELISVEEPKAPPHFTLPSDLSIQVGKVAKCMIKVSNGASTEGYFVKSIAVKDIISGSRRSYAEEFGLDTLMNKPIPPEGLSFTFILQTNLKAGNYRLRLTLGKYGIGSRATEQRITATIRVDYADEGPTPTLQPSLHPLAHAGDACADV